MQHVFHLFFILYKHLTFNFSDFLVKAVLICVYAAIFTQHFQLNKDFISGQQNYKVIVVIQKKNL